MKRTLKNASLFFGFLVVTVLTLNQCISAEITPHPLPEFTQTSPNAWIQSEPLKTESLKGKVTLIDIWTFECWNCYRSFPWLNDIEARLKPKGFNVIGIHSPEFEHERDANKVLEKAQKFGLKHPTMLDNDFAYWRALNNRYWPTFYLVDKKGMIRYRFIGETHSNTSKALEIELAINKLLEEPAH